MKLDLLRETFSVPGAMWALSDVRFPTWDRFHPSPEGLAFRTVRGDRGCGLLATPALTRDGEKLPLTPEAQPGLLTVSAPGAKMEITFLEPHTLRLRGKGAALELTLPGDRYDEFFVYPGGSWVCNGSGEGTKLMFTVLSGEVDITDPGLERRQLPKVFRLSGEWELLLTEFTWVFEPLGEIPAFEASVSGWQADFAAYTRAMPPPPAGWEDGFLRAAYVNWSTQVGPEGVLHRRVMLMSKNWMDWVWSWDHAFNAVEAAPHHPDIAWDNFALPFDTQHPSGLLQDMVNDARISHGYTKPPIHGWALARLRQAGAVTPERLAWIYPRLSAWTDYWFRYADWDGDGLCQYAHGNDSGWDNCTCFQIGAPIEGPELAAYLVLQMDELSADAALLGKPAEAESWKRRADAQLEALLSHFWDGRRMRVLQSGTHREQTGCDSLFPYLTLILGERLPKPVFDTLTAGLKEDHRFLTPYGLATESVSSPWYNPDGYWRGPVWAPPMMFMIDGLRRGGEAAFARELALRFCTNAQIQGFAENFDAETGAGLRDRAYTWTSSVFLLLLREALQD